MRNAHITNDPQVIRHHAFHHNAIKINILIFLVTVSTALMVVLPVMITNHVLMKDVTTKKLMKILKMKEVKTMGTSAKKKLNNFIFKKFKESHLGDAIMAMMMGTDT